MILFWFYFNGISNRIIRINIKSLEPVYSTSSATPFLSFSRDDTKWPTRVDMSLNKNKKCFGFKKVFSRAMIGLT